jgi:hypothetical protein
MTPLIKSTIGWMFKAGLDPTEMMWFDATGTFDGKIPETKWLVEHRPPFEKCMVVWQGKKSDNEIYEVIMTVVGTGPEEGIVLSVHMGQHGQMPVKLPLMFYFLEDGAIKYGPVDENETIKRQDADQILGFVANWYSMLSEKCPSYKPVVRDTFTNRRKVAQKKMPLYDWTTVVIEPTKNKSEPKGGTHASPRLHDRRGHLRRLRSGKNVWVKPCKVGDASKGTIFHDYTFKVAA